VNLKSLRKPPVQTIMGHRIPEPRPTLMALLWVMLYLGLPLVLLGMLVDLLVQTTTGACTGVWCWFG